MKVYITRRRQNTVGGWGLPRGSDTDAKTPRMSWGRGVWWVECCRAKIAHEKALWLKELYTIPGTEGRRCGTQGVGSRGEVRKLERYRWTAPTLCKTSNAITRTLVFILKMKVSLREKRGYDIGFVFLKDHSDCSEDRLDGGGGSLRGCRKASEGRLQLPVVEMTVIWTQNVTGDR